MLYVILLHFPFNYKILYLKLKKNRRQKKNGMKLYETPNYISKPTHEYTNKEKDHHRFIYLKVK